MLRKSSTFSGIYSAVKIGKVHGTVVGSSVPGPIADSVCTLTPRS